MTHHYIIAVDVKPEFALAAYSRGLSDLEKAWPRLMKIARAKDAEHADQEAKIDELRKQAWEKWDKARAAKFEKWEVQKQKLIDWERSNSFFRGPKPVVPWPPIDLGPSILLPRSTRQSAVSRYEDMRYRLKSKRNLAAAAAGPFKMSEADVDSMTRWGNGEMVTFLLETAGEHP
jgi:hypothetical protein